MSSEDLERVKELLHEALDLAPAERVAFLDSRCGGNSELRSELESLLAFENTEQPWQEGPILSLLDSTPGLRPDQRIGPYRILRLLGEGGMGTVALAARQDDFEKKVALKIISPYRMSADLVHRFHNERQLLAHLEHPNIARILDGGTTDEGHPYFVMEYVEGEPIDVWCRRRRPSLKERLELFVRICSAIQLAHRSLVVHRDLKPSNILVTGAGEPKLLDFGIAKRLEPDDNRLTRLTQRPMTVRYASPEQISGQPITTATDTYCLGLLLFELLTGRYPYPSEKGSDLEIAQAIRDHEPRKPSTAFEGPRSQKRDLVGDLDSIVLKAMRKEPERRYLSVEQLADDVRRFLTGRTVLARKGTWTYRVGKFARRYRWPLSAIGSIVVLSLALGATTTVLWRQAVAAEQEAAQEQRRTGFVLEFMKNIFRDGGPNQGGAQLTALQLLERGRLRVEDIQDPLSKAEILATIGDVFAKLELYDRADSAWQEAEEVLRRHFPQGHPKLAKAINNRAVAFFYLGDYVRAEQKYREALVMKEAFAKSSKVDLAKAQSNLATSLLYLGRFDEAEELYRRSLNRRRQASGSSHPSVAASLHNLGVLYYTTRDFERAAPLLQEAFAIREHELGTKHKSVASTAAALGRVYHARKAYPQAADLYSRALQTRRHLHLEEGAADGLIELDLGRLYLDLGEADRAEPHIEKGLSVLRREKAPGTWEVAWAESVFGAYLITQSRFEEAEAYLVKGQSKLAEARGAESLFAEEARLHVAALHKAWGAEESNRPW